MTTNIVNPPSTHPARHRIRKVAVSTRVIELERFEMQRGEAFAPPAHDDHQLVWTPDGILAVEILDRYWMLPTTLALWVPAGVLHTPLALRESVMEGIYLDPARTTRGWESPTAVRMTPLTRHLIAHLRQPLAPEPRARAEAVLLDVLAPAETSTITVPLPADERALAVARRILADPADPRTLEEHGREVGASSRTLLRVFLRETGLPFSTWKTHARLKSAVGLLAEGSTVSQASYLVGYSTPSAFIAAFHRTTGQTPGAYFS